MSTKANLYIDQALAATGFAVIDITIARILRPDLWPSGAEAAWDFSPRFFRPIDRTGVRRYRGFLEGREDSPVEILARSHDRLAMRVEWVTGLKLTDLYEDVTERSPATAAPAVARRARDTQAGDVHGGVITQDSGRPCGDCDHLSAGGRCLQAPATGIEWPNQAEPRRCVVFQPRSEALDQRDGKKLWTELKEVAHA